MRDDNEGGPCVLKLTNPVRAFVNEVGISHRQDFIHNQNVGSKGGGDRKSEARLHAAGIGPNGFIEIGANFCKGFNRWDGLDDLIVRGPHQP